MGVLSQYAPFQWFTLLHYFVVALCSRSRRSRRSLLLRGAMGMMGGLKAVSYTHLTLPTKLEV